MKVDKKKLKAATKADLLKEVSIINDELSDEMHPASGARCAELIEYKRQIIIELETR